MAEHLSDEQQLETLKRWWQENGRQLVVGVVLILGAWLGWQQWQEGNKQQAEHASLLFMELMEQADESDLSQLSASDKSQLIDLAAQLKEQHGDRQYAYYAGLLLAKLAVQEGELERAAVELRAVLESSTGEALADIVRLRLARVEMARGEYSAALGVLDIEEPEAMQGQFSELRGDIHYLAGDQAAARAAYQRALDLIGESDRRLRALLELKLNQVLPAPVKAAAGNGESS